VSDSLLRLIPVVGVAVLMEVLPGGKRELPECKLSGVRYVRHFESAPEEKSLMRGRDVSNEGGNGLTQRSETSTRKSVPIPYGLIARKQAGNHRERGFLSVV
jgi:hypothetical protein